MPDTFPEIRSNWTNDQILEYLQMPLLELLYQAQTVHRKYWPENTVQLASLLSIKTGSCPEDCKYCPQSAHYTKQTGMQKEVLMDIEDVLRQAKTAKDAGATRFCMGAAWSKVRDGKEFDQVLEMVSGVSDMEMEACVTLGMLSANQAKRLKDAGLTSYNHNIDSSPEFYEEIITTRKFDERLETLDHARKAGLSLCTGGIIGMGESLEDRAEMLRILSGFNPHPESVPINALVAVKGTPLEDRPSLPPMEMVRMIATARILMPKSRVRLSAGRTQMSEETQTLCFMAGANSIFYGEKLLTTDNPDTSSDKELINHLGMKTEASKNLESI